MDMVIKANDDIEGGVYEYQNGEKGLPRERSLPEIQNTIGKPSAPINRVRNQEYKPNHLQTIPTESLKGQLSSLQPNLRNVPKYQSQM